MLFRSALNWFSQRLTKRQFSRCVEQCPDIAIISLTCRARLTGQQLNYCISMCPAAALEWVGGLLTDVQFAYCVDKKPWQALLFVPSRLESEQLVRIASDHPESIDEHFREYPDTDLLKVLAPYLNRFDDVTKVVFATQIERTI